MSPPDSTILTYEIREVVAYFDEASKFEAAVSALEDRGIRRAHINLLGSHDAIREKLGHHYVGNKEIDADNAAPQVIFSDKRETNQGKALAVGLPVYIGGAGAGLAILATGGTLALAGVVAAAGLTAGAGLGTLLSGAIGRHHAKFLEQQLSLGHLAICVTINSEREENDVIAICKTHGGTDINAHTISRYWERDDFADNTFDPRSIFKGG